MTAEQERASVVDWLRTSSSSVLRLMSGDKMSAQTKATLAVRAGTLSQIADAIERGDHLKGATPNG